MNRSLPSVAALALAACFAPACLAAYTATAGADVTARGEAIVGAHDPVVLGVGDSDHQTVLTGTATADAATGIHAQQDSADAGGGSSGWAQVGAGGIHLLATAGGNAVFLTPNNSGFARIIGRSMASARGSFSDGLTFHMSQVALGAPLVLTFSVDVTGSLGGQGQFAAGMTGFATISEMRWQVALGNLSDGRTERQQVLNGIATQSAPATGIWTFVATVGNGQATTLTMEATAGASAQGGINCFGCGLSTLYAEGQSSIDFSHTFAWNGVQGVADAAGHALDLTELQVESSSGFDYLGGVAAPVPELSSPAMLAVGLLVLFVRRRQRGADC